MATRARAPPRASPRALRSHEAADGVAGRATPTAKAIPRPRAGPRTPITITVASTTSAT